MKVYVDGKKLLDNLIIADTFFKRLMGWIGKQEINREEGLLLTSCKRIHTFGMKCAIDVVFLDADHTIITVISQMRPNRLSPYVKEASSVLELMAGTITINCIGSSIVFSPRHTTNIY